MSDTCTGLVLMLIFKVLTADVHSRYFILKRTNENIVQVIHPQRLFPTNLIEFPFPHVYVCIK